MDIYIKKTITHERIILYRIRQLNVSKIENKVFEIKNTQFRTVNLELPLICNMQKKCVIFPKI